MLRSPDAKEAPETWRRGLRWAGAAEALGAGDELVAGAEIRGGASCPSPACGEVERGYLGRWRRCWQLSELSSVRGCGLCPLLAALLASFLLLLRPRQRSQPSESPLAPPPEPQAALGRGAHESAGPAAAFAA